MWLEALGKMPPRILTLAKINMRILNSKIPHAKVSQTTFIHSSHNYSRFGHLV